MRGVLLSLPSGDAGTRATLARMASWARSSAVHPLIRQVAARQVRSTSPDGGHEAAMRLAHWIGDHVMFLPDPSGVEALHDPVWSLREILTGGIVGLDCDDVAMLAAALGLSIGLRAQFVVVGFNSPNAPFGHVWTDLAGWSRSAPWIPVDPTRPAQGLDVLPISRRMTWGV